MTAAIENEAVVSERDSCASCLHYSIMAYTRRPNAILAVAVLLLVLSCMIAYCIGLKL